MAAKPKLQEICERAYSTAETLLNRKVESIVSMSKDEDGWRVEAEVIERKCIPDTQDLIGKYELKFDDAGDLLCYKRIDLRRRCMCNLAEIEEEV